VPSSANPRELLYRLILAELIARPGQGPLARRTLPRPQRAAPALEPRALDSEPPEPEEPH
jgi:hypothetical protein